MFYEKLCSDKRNEIGDLLEFLNVKSEANVDKALKAFELDSQSGKFDSKNKDNLLTKQDIVDADVLLKRLKLGFSCGMSDGEFFAAFGQ